MKLLRYGPPGAEKPGMLDAEGAIRDLSGIIDDLSGAALSREGLARLAALDPASLPRIEGQPRLGIPFAGTRNFVCIGLNYADHAAETGAQVPKEPIVFLKSLSALCGPTDDIIVPPGSRHTDWETELAIVIGSVTTRVSEAQALDHVAGYAVANDVSERDWQNNRGGAWDKGKGFDTFGPLGPWLVTKDEVPDPQALDIFLDLDGQRMQDGNTRTMIFGVRTLISYVSQFFTLHPGDVISTGTPPGVGFGRKPQLFLRPGQTLRFGIAGLGEQQHRTIGVD
ncbi:fumarylacetoacetate hydrolase family protein [Falsiroseomonas tokyonensis]|uniref:Fumarylacetoacetate hydrolase family protein n=1 Tax=Falsiroseomonas tokyonensis TaxID=430521 RepID=A0ABV7BX11_9PROT|nr:fumarylacetoacetate hydrolase family protein [Falsiroseomonas tokyonensis]MBU8539411.1 fumarylacetoacetate hydrolase family protein [Falsiroseomonas tokyonensis]